MDMKTEIKEEPSLESTPEEMKCISEQPVSYVINSIKEYKNADKFVALNTCIQNDFALKKEYHNSTISCINYVPKEFKMEIKEDPSLESDLGSDVTDSVSSEALLKVQTTIPECSQLPEIDTRESVKENPLWQEETSEDIKNSSETLPPLQNELQDARIYANGIHTECLSSESKSYSGSSTADGSDNSTSFSCSTLEKDDNLNMMEHQSDFEKARLNELEENDGSKISHVRGEINVTGIKQKSQNGGQRASLCEVKKLDTKAYKCDICEKEFARKPILRTHVLTHVDRKPYKCEICEKSFIRKSSLREHNMNHEGKKPYNCNFCERSFKRMPALSLHLLTHETKKPPIISCKLCKKSFIHMIDFITHKKLHDGKALQLCELCGKIFPFMSSFKRHYIIAHETRRQYKCEICGISFKHKHYLKRHVYVVHEIKKLAALQVL